MSNEKISQTESHRRERRLNKRMQIGLKYLVGVAVVSGLASMGLITASAVEAPSATNTPSEIAAQNTSNDLGEVAMDVFAGTLGSLVVGGVSIVLLMERRDEEEETRSRLRGFQE